MCIRDRLPTVRPMRAWEPAVLAALRVTKGARSEYDHLMLGLHDRAKADADYQARSPLRAGIDVDLLFGPGDARRDERAVHARADDPSSARGHVRARPRAAR